MKNQQRQPSEELLRTLAKNLKRFRRARGYSQTRLGMLCDGLSKNYISNIEQKKVNITLANLEALMIGLNCTANDLLMRKPE